MDEQAKTHATVLLVEDHPGVRFMLGAGLKAQGFDVLSAATGEKALALCRGFEGPIDVLITDIGLTPPDCWPEQESAEAIVHGVALARAALDIRPALKVMLLTGYSAERLHVLGKQVHEFRVLTKPCDLHTMVAEVRSLLASPQTCKGR